MLGGCHAKRLVLAVLVAACASTGLAGATISPDVVNDNPPVTLEFSITNDGGQTNEVTIKSPLTNGGSEAFYILSENEVDAPQGWNITLLNRDGDGTNDAVRLTDNTLSGGGSLSVNITYSGAGPQGQSFGVNLSNGESYSGTIFVDGTAPQVSSKEPTRVNLTDDRPSIEASFSDGQGIGVDTAELRLFLDGTDITDNSSFSTTSASYDPTDDLAEGRHNVSLYLVDRFGHDRWVNWTFSLAVAPLLRNPRPTGVITEQRPTFEATYLDPSALATDSSSDTHYWFHGTRYDGGDETFSTEKINDTAWYVRLDTPVELSDGFHWINLTAQDSNGNTATLDWNVTVDTTPPVFDSISVSDGDTYTGDMPIFVTASDATTNVTRVTMEIADEEDEVSEEIQDEFRGHIDTTEVGDGTHTLEVTAYDAAGNTRTRRFEVTVDNKEPRITYTDLFPDPTNVPPRLQVTARDDATQVLAAEYYIGDDPGTGQANPLTVTKRNELETTFEETIDVNDLENGNYTLHVRVKDGVQHWSETREISFALDRSLKAAIAFASVPAIRSTQGISTTTRIDIKNTGKVPGKVNLSVDAPFPAQVVKNNRLLQAGATRAFYVNVSVPENTSIGNYTVDLVASTSSTLANTSTTLVVEADEETRAAINGTFSDLEQRIERLQERKNNWKKQLSDHVIQNITERIADLNSTLQQAQDSMEVGNYRYARSVADDLAANVEEARGDLDTQIRQFKQARNRRNIIIVAIALIITTAAVLWHRYTPPEEGFRGEAERFIHRPGGKHPLQVRGEEVLERLRERLEHRKEQAARLMRDYRSDRGDEEEPEGWGGYSPEA